MFDHYRTQGLILKKTNRGESDRLFTIYTKDFGKLEILGKAVRKISSKLRSGIEIFYLSEVEFVQGKTYKTLTDAILIEKFENLRKDFKKSKIAHKIVEISDNLISGQEPDQKIWQLFTETFKKLNSLSLSINHSLTLYYYFFWNLISILGYQIGLYNCPSCFKKLKPEKIYFNPKEEGIICQDCFKKNRIGKEINIEVVKILRIISNQDWKLLSKIRIKPSDFKNLELISRAYLNRVLEIIK